MPDKPITAYKNSVELPPQSQSLPGSDKDLAPEAEHSKVEYWDNGRPYLKEYEGSGKLKGKKAIITGGDSGIGRAAAVFFAREGADVTLVYLPEEQHDAESVKKEIAETSSQRAHLIATDLKEESSYQRVVESHLKEYGQLDILVNNASQQIMCHEIQDMDPKNVEATFRTNILQMIYLSKAAVPHMQRGSSIINTTSVTAYKGSAYLIDYSTTKGAIVSFTRSLSMQLAPKGIRVNAIAPGPVYTPLQPASRSADNMEGWGLGQTPLHGRAAQPAELGEAYVFLAGPGSNFMTGSVLHINGGQHVGGS
ncbi:tropinone reductase 1 [Moniliophthora roreri MCA 2997]|uniref:Tropinone reductase 1 n=2 Tax=Moniliophthora roreri TaxID=221103 RepID=V2WMP1_MONRO|nr:tropinone reductase 1 [Moniliophthora roreri MCA 2997]KAI3609785.1 tropinone reductase 1 [Moniliophthora roreri]